MRDEYVLRSIEPKIHTKSFLNVIFPDHNKGKDVYYQGSRQMFGHLMLHGAFLGEKRLRGFRQSGLGANSKSCRDPALPVFFRTGAGGKDAAGGGAGKSTFRVLDGSLLDVIT